jgi:hypothetical protein
VPSGLSMRNAVLAGALAGWAVTAIAFPLPSTAASVLGSVAVPTAACSQMIYSGATPKGIHHLPHDVVVGPVRFNVLDPRGFVRVAESQLLGIKSPMTVGPTHFKTLLVSAKGAKSPVGIAYGQVPSTTTTSVDLFADSDQVLVQAPVSCGLPATGFAQYGGGFVVARKQCVTLTVSLPGGRVLARRTVPFGSSVSCVSSH